MNRMRLVMAVVLVMGITACAQPPKGNDNAAKSEKTQKRFQKQGQSIQLGPRSYFLVNVMDPGALREELLACSPGLWILATGGGFYYQGIEAVINNDGDMLEVLDVLAQDVVFSGSFPTGRPRSTTTLIAKG